MNGRDYTNPNSPQPDLFPELQVVYASFWDRFAAVLIDAIILFIPNLVIRYLIGAYGSAFFINILLNWLYAAIMESSNTQATIGKKALGLKVTSLNGERILFGQATARHFSKILSTIILFIGYLMMIWDPRRQTLHDQIANTLVVKNPEYRG